LGSIELEADAFRLRDMQWLHVFAGLKVPICFGHEVGKEVEGLSGRRYAIALGRVKLVVR
jgi:hypothetical protein